MIREVFTGAMAKESPNVLICDTGCSNVQMEPEEIEANARLHRSRPGTSGYRQVFKGNYARLADLAADTTARMDVAISKAEGRA